MTYYDLSHSIRSGMPVFPGDPPVDITPAATVEDDGYHVAALHCGSHTGTHIDAPSHVFRDGSALDSIAVDEFVFDARLVDCTGKSPRESIEAADLPAPDGTADLLLCHTGWDEYWGTDRYFDHPYLTPGAAEHCREAGWSVGLDTLNPDPTPTENATDSEPAGFQAHHTLLGDGSYVIENLTGLESLPAEESIVTLVAFPLPITEADGAPIRAVAIDSDDQLDDGPF
ncbi:cyclase family protein [Natrialba aegyptia]|uniref:Cyclase n=1 Tax=Natrialba aegyptia DSM 13077 TaxID=1227491 RepID=M0BCP5_9EURY|nr:cyclase family protein [Natrialba aegyptia]ELZ07424.1 cyclase [Natrialba aegyptia DSM 13077]